MCMLTDRQATEDVRRQLIISPTMVAYKVYLRMGSTIVSPLQYVEVSPDPEGYVWSDWSVDDPYCCQIHKVSGDKILCKGIHVYLCQREAKKTCAWLNTYRGSPGNTYIVVPVAVELEHLLGVSEDKIQAGFRRIGLYHEAMDNELYKLFFGKERGNGKTNAAEESNPRTNDTVGASKTL